MKVTQAVLAAVLAMTATAGADPVAPPTGWREDPSLAVTPSSARFGGAKTKVGVWAYRSPQRGGVLFVNRAEAELPADRRDALATAELGELAAALRRQGATAKAESAIQRVMPDHQLEAALTWRDADAGIIDASRIVIAADAERTVAVTGQCVLAADAPATVIDACVAALGTLATDVPPAGRIALAIAAQPAEPEPEPAEASDRPRIEPARLDDGTRVTLPPMAVTPDPVAPDRRPVYVGLGLLLLAALFYWNRRQRERFEPETPRAPRRRAGRDEDAEDLHAAADASDDGAPHDR